MKYIKLIFCFPLNLLMQLTMTPDKLSANPEDRQTVDIHAPLTDAERIELYGSADGGYHPEEEAATSAQVTDNGGEGGGTEQTSSASSNQASSDAAPQDSSAQNFKSSGDEKIDTVLRKYGGDANDYQGVINKAANAGASQEELGALWNAREDKISADKAAGGPGFTEWDGTKVENMGKWSNDASKPSAMITVTGQSNFEDPGSAGNQTFRVGAHDVQTARQSYGQNTFAGQNFADYSAKVAAFAGNTRDNRGIAINAQNTQGGADARAGTLQYKEAVAGENNGQFGAAQAATKQEFNTYMNRTDGPNPENWGATNTYQYVDPTTGKTTTSTYDQRSQGNKPTWNW